MEIRHLPKSMSVITPIDFKTFITGHDSEHICVITCDDLTRRKKIHQYLEHVPKIGHLSLHSEMFPSTQRVFKKCFECNTLVALEYHRGWMDNNQDEFYGGYCPKCGESNEWECNYDSSDDIIKVRGHNMIIVGHFHIKKHKHAEEDHITPEEFDELLQNTHIHMIPNHAYSYHRKKHEIETYVDECLRNEGIISQN